jgi:hypothetical protein
MDILKFVLNHGKELVETGSKRLREGDLSQVFGAELLGAIEGQGKKLQEELIKGLTKVKTGLAEENQQNKEMLELYYRFTRGEAETGDMERANEQFRRFLKTLGIGALLVMPLAPITIPAVIKLGDKLGVDILPEWIKD